MADVAVSDDTAIFDGKIPIRIHTNKHTQCCSIVVKL